MREFSYRHDYVAKRLIRTLVTGVATISLVFATTGPASAEVSAFEVEVFLHENGLAPTGAPQFSADGVARGENVKVVVADDASLRVNQPGSHDFIGLTPRRGERTHEETEGPLATFGAQTGLTVVQALPEGGRIVEVINNPTADSAVTFVYDIDVPSGVKLVQGPDGAVAAVRETVDATMRSLEIIGTIKSPWALDANGTPQPASYSLDGQKITMTVTPDAAARYPIVADPEAVVGDYKLSWPLTSPTRPIVYANKRGSVAINIGSGGLCAAVSLIPVAGAALSALCYINEAYLGIGQLYGKCQWVRFDLLSRRYTKGLYSGGFCR